MKINIYIYIYIYTSIYIYKDKHRYIHIYIYICVYLYAADLKISTAPSTDALGSVTSIRTAYPSTSARLDSPYQHCSRNS